MSTALMPRRYRLPVRALLQTLRAQHERTALSAMLPVVPGFSRQAGTVTLLLGGGHLPTCTIRRRDGRVLVQGTTALKLLEQLGNLEWQVEDVPSNGAAWSTSGGNGPAPSWSQEQTTEQRMPRRRVAQLSPAQQQALSHRQRQVFALADGTRSVASIAMLLHLSPDTVVRLLHELRQHQLLD